MILRVLAIGVLAASCRASLGTFDECSTDAECGGRGDDLHCVDRLCVARPPLDPRCTRLGDTTAGAFTFGSVLPLTRTDGSENPTGMGRLRSLQLAIEQTNPPTRQGVRGRPIGLISCDSTGRTDAVVELTQKLVERRVLAVLSSTSAETIAAARVTVPAGMLLMSVSATAGELTDLADRAPDAGSGDPGLVWRTAAPDALQAGVLSQFLVDAGTPKTAVVHVNDAYGQGLAAAFGRDYPGQKVVFPFAQGGPLDPAVDGAEASMPGAVLIVAFPDDAARLASTMRRKPALQSARLVFTDSARSPVLLVPEANGAFGTSGATASGEAQQYFTGQYLTRFGSDPLAIGATANAFDAMMCLMLALHVSNGSGGPPLAKGLAALSRGTKVPLVPTSFTTLVRELDTAGTVNVDGASGPLDFDASKGEAPAPIELWRITNLAFEQVRVVVP